MPVSGRYEGTMTAPASGLERLDLRVDVDALVEHATVTRRVSGDVFAADAGGVPSADGRYRHRHSWIVDAPSVEPQLSHVDIAGSVRVWNRPGVSALVRVRIPADGRSAVVTLTGEDGVVREYACARVSDELRHLEMQLDVCRTAGDEVRLPEYDVESHDNRPPAAALRRLSLRTALREAGIAVSFRPHAVIDRPDVSEHWSTTDLNDALAQRVDDGGAPWPRWQVWGLLAGRHQDSNTGGLMFNTVGPARRGFAVFRDHPWFALLPEGEPRDDLQAAAARKYLFTWVHEIGHTFNLVHSSEKGRPDSPSWMNYDGEYDARNGRGSFWRDFHFRFDDEELIHIRHGNLPAVIMGGDPFRSGPHLRSCCANPASGRRSRRGR
jgi:hypothetical protein